MLPWMPQGVEHRRIPLFLAVLALIWLAAAPARAQNPHFVRTSCTLQADGDLQCSFKEAGLGDTATDYTLSADASTTCACVNNGGHCPQAANKVTFDSAVSQDATFSPKNGTVSATLVASAPACPSSAPPTCGGGQHLVLSQITYTAIALADVTHNVAASDVPDTLSATFFTCP